MSNPQLDRRRFLALTAASLAFSRLTGCTRQPPERIVPYVEQPELLAGRTRLRFATSMVERGYATGLLVDSVQGRPVKVEGNPQHPSSLGATDAFAQAWLFSLCDPDRAQIVTRLGRITTWESAARELARLVAERGGPGGVPHVRLLTEAHSSPTLAAEIAALVAEHPGVRWHRWEPCGLHHTRAGMRLAFGAPLEVVHDLSAADVIVAIESDFAASGPGCLRHARDFARRRAVGDESAMGHASAVLGSVPLPPSPSMNRLYSIESAPTCTGTLADHRLPLSPTLVTLFAAALAAELGVAPALPVPPKIARLAAVAAADLRRAGPRALVLAGEPALPEVHALVAAMNVALGSAGSTVFHTDPVEADPVDHTTSIRELCDDMRAGLVSLLVILGGNPVYTAPAELDFAGAMARVDTRVHLTALANETSPLCHLTLPEAHGLEAWGDARAYDGTVTLAQPLIAPLYQGKTPLAVVAALRGEPPTSDLDLLRAHSRGALASTDFDALWGNAVALGFFPGTASAPRRVALLAGAAAAAARQIDDIPRGGGYELAIRPDPTVLDGRHASNAWLQELPKPHTTLTWDNAALLSPRTAVELGVQDEDIVEIGRAGRTVRAPVLVLAGHPDDTVTVHLGYGQNGSSAVAAGLGYDAYPLRSLTALWHLPGVLLRKAGARRALATTQRHFELHGRANVRVATLAEMAVHPGLIHEMGHDPPRSLSLYPEWEHEGPAWGMAVDQSICTGCSSCVLACQAENNSPVVGRDGVLAGREMHWLRIDRYVVPTAAEPVIVHQPMMCVHCEKAPCEYVCPVEATSHSADGLNEMTYNRCIGTRYCQNNCPYKVRRFNFFDYTGDRPEALKIVLSPEVTVRSRGVMEKCTYCVQRLRNAVIADRVSGRPVATPELMTACQQACPTGAITFGDIRSPLARVSRLKQLARGYHVLAELGTRPRTSHLARIRNPNPELPEHG